MQTGLLLILNCAKEPQLIKRQSCHHIETSQLSCKANQLTGFYMMATLAFNELKWNFYEMNISIF